ncbi:acyl--CoA ligase [Actinoallomurus sp. NBC_01490]|uniref:class I adenylate-forming enzyme family protein n=1 Tax=Actinoallomurus sp. NBC_01490 TaxID=2903557 RepID=UPI002E33FE1A|nr:class I adenylate-forming enzyme family protein [Actinoallomurus sp. NBC_01490]
MTFDYVNQGDAVSLTRPDHPAFVETDTAGAALGTWTYAEFDTAVRATGQWLREQGFPIGARVGLVGLNSVRWVVAFYALQRAGLVPVPISHKLPRSGVEYILTDSGAVAVFTDERALSVDLPRFPLEEVGCDLAADPERFVSHRPAPTDAAMFLYTSGSTGRPKGVVLSQRSHLWVLEVRAATPPPPGNRNLVAAPLYHMNALANVQSALATGVTSVVMPAFDARGYLRAIAEHRVTRLTAVPPMIAMLFQERDLVQSLDLSSVTEVFMGSAPASQSLFDQVRAVLPGARVQFGYGTTESGPIAFTAHPGGLPTPDGSVGVADPHVELRLVDGAGTVVPDQGVLEIRCPALMTGYHNRPDVPDPVTADGFYHTKDIFRVDGDGFYFFVGRSDDMFVSGGENIYPGEVERVIQSHPDVLHSAVVPVPDEIKGTKPVAFVVVRAGAEADAEGIKRHVLEHAPAYQHPRRVWFVDALPLSSTNKIDRASLTERARKETLDDLAR